MPGKRNAIASGTALYLKSTPPAGTQPFPARSPERSAPGHGDLSVSQIAGFYLQSGKAKRSLLNFNYAQSSGDAGSVAASRARQGHRFAGEDHSPAPPAKDCGRIQRRRLGNVPHCSFVLRFLQPPAAPGLTYRHRFYGECSSNFSTSLRNQPTGPFSRSSIPPQNKSQHSRTQSSGFPQSPPQASGVARGLFQGMGKQPGCAWHARRDF